MCRRTDCTKCGRPTFAGCGAHVEQVLGDVPPADRCRCREEKAMDAAAALRDPLRDKCRSWVCKLLGK